MICGIGTLTIQQSGQYTGRRPQRVHDVWDNRQCPLMYKSWLLWPSMTALRCVGHVGAPPWDAHDHRGEMPIRSHGCPSWKWRSPLGLNFMKAAQETNAGTRLIIRKRTLTTPSMQHWKAHLTHSQPYQAEAVVQQLINSEVDHVAI